MTLNVPEINKNYFLNTNTCPTISKYSEVVVEHVLNFPSTKKQFVTIRDAINMTGKYNNDPIVATLPLTGSLLLEALPTEALHTEDPILNPHSVLVKRYLQLIKASRPALEPIKDPNGSLKLSHALWMLEKMDDPTYVPLTTTSAWLSWVQASLFTHNLINIQHEKDITREILNQYSVPNSIVIVPTPTHPVETVFLDTYHYKDDGEVTRFYRYVLNYYLIYDSNVRYPKLESIEIDIPPHQHASARASIANQGLLSVYPVKEG